MNTSCSNVVISKSLANVVSFVHDADPAPTSCSSSSMLLIRAIDDMRVRAYMSGMISIFCSAVQSKGLYRCTIDAFDLCWNGV